MNKRSRTQGLLLRMMTTRVHPIVYLCVAISVWHSAVTVMNGLQLPDSHSLVFLGKDDFNLAVGNVGVITGLALMISLRYARWGASAYLALANLSAWTFTLVILAANGVWGGTVMAFFYVILHVYISIASVLHKEYGYETIRNPRKVFYESQKQAYLRDARENQDDRGRDALDWSS